MASARTLSGYPPPPAAPPPPFQQQQQPPSHSSQPHHQYHPAQHQLQYQSLPPGYPPTPVTAPPVPTYASATVDHRVQQQQPPPPVQSRQPAHHSTPYYTQSAALPPIQTTVQQHQPAGDYKHPPQQPQHQTHHPSQRPPPPYQYAQQGGGASDGSTLPPFRPPSTTQQSPREAAREQSDHIQYSAQSRSGHATPAPVMQRLQDSSLYPLRTPSTPAQAAHYPPQGFAPEPAHTPMQHADSGAPLHFGGPPAPVVANGVHTVLHHEAQQSYGPMPVPDHPQYAMHPHPQAAVYIGPASNYAVGAVASASKKKPMRAQQACEQCRQRKQKCDEGSPCSFCAEQSIECNYRDPGPAKTDKNTEKIMRSLDNLLEDNQKMRELFEDLNGRLKSVETSNGTVAPQAQAIPGVNGAVSQSSNWDDHRTGIHNLIMLWPSVQPFFREMQPPTAIDSSYVMRAEDRGVLRIHGRGEGVDEQDSVQYAAPSSPAPSEDSNDSAPTPREGSWSRGFTSNSYPEAVRPCSTQGGLKSDGALDLEPATIMALYESYMKHMWIMHPFLDRVRTRKLVDTFVARCRPKASIVNRFVVHSNIETDRPVKRQRFEGSVSNSSMPAPESSVRSVMQFERSPSNAIVWLILALGKICQHSAPLPPVNESRSAVSQAMTRQVTSNSGHTSASPMPLSIKQSPISPNSTPIPQPTSSENGHTRTEPRSRRSSFDSTTNGAARNVEYIPGLAYYAKASEILGDHQDGSELVHAQMFLLAALYKGQLARVRESMAWLMPAGRVCQGLIERHKLYRPTHGTHLEKATEITRLLKNKHSRLIVITSWTCLQLEADILAEMKYPASGIQSLEEKMILPYMSDEDDVMSVDDVQTTDGVTDLDIRVNKYYSAQLFLRRTLNKAHRMLYGSQLRNQTIQDVQQMLAVQDNDIKCWRYQLIPSDLRWDDDDPPATDILAARLRAKYWGAMYVTRRPFLDYALHIMPRTADMNCSVEQAARDGSGNSRHPADIVLFETINSMATESVWKACGECIAAALRSTVALDAVPARLIVTNIHGTAHAQFGNMLVLAAAYNVEYAKKLVPREQFQEKLERTIKFLRLLSPISPTCAIDCSILERIQQKLFTTADVKQIFQDEIEPMSATNSFSS